MTDFLTNFVGGPEGTDDRPSAGTDPSARLVDERDVPQPAPGMTPLTHEWVDPSDDADAYADAPPRWPVVIPDELRTIPAAVHVTYAQTTTFAIGEGGIGRARQLGMEPSRVQAQTIAYAVVTVTAAATDYAAIVLDAGGSPTMRFRVPTGVPLTLPGVAGVWVEACDLTDGPVDAAVSVSVLVTAR